MDPHPTHDSYGPSKLTTQTASLSVQPSLHRRPLSFPILYNGTPILPPRNLPLPMGDLDPHLIHGSPGPPKSSTQTAARSVQPFFAGLTSVIDRPTDHATRSVRIGHIYVSLAGTAGRRSQRNSRHGHVRRRSQTWSAGRQCRWATTRYQHQRQWRRCSGCRSSSVRGRARSTTLYKRCRVSDREQCCQHRARFPFRQSRSMVR